MSDGANLELVVKARDEAQGVLDKLKSGIGDVVKTAASFAIGGALTKLPDFFTSAAQSAADDEASQLRLQKAIENTGRSYSSVSDVIQNNIKHAQRLAFTDDQYRDSLSILTAQTGDVEEATQRLDLAMDLSRGTGMDLVASSKLLGKVTDDNVNVLKKYGISVEKGASETDLFSAVYAKFHGQAQTFADSTAGKMARFKDQMGELKESIGYAVLPVMTEGASLALKLGGALSDVVGGAIDKIQANVGPAFRLFKDAVTGNFMDAHAAFLALPDDLQKYGQTIFDVGSKIHAALPGIKDAALDAFANIKSIFSDFAADASKTFNDLKNDPSVKEAFQHIADAGKLVVDFYKLEWPAIKLEIREVVEYAKAQIEGFIQAFKGIVEVVSGVIDLVVDLFHGRWKDAWDDLKEIAKGVLDLMIGNLKVTFGNIPELILDVLGDAQDAATRLLNSIVDALESLPDRLYDLGRRAGQRLIDGIKSIPGSIAGEIGSVASSALGSIGIHGAGNYYAPTPELAIIGDSPGGEYVLTPSQVSRLASGGAGGTVINLNFSGATIYGWSDFKAKVGQAVRDIHNGGGGILVGAT